MAVSEDPWVREYNEAVKLACDISTMISESGSLPATAPESQRHASNIRRKITMLRTRLNHSLVPNIHSKNGTGKKLKSKEIKRRQDMVDTLKSKVAQMASTMNMERMFAITDIGRICDVEAATEGLDNRGIIGLQRQMMKEQDDELEKLEEGLVSVKHIAMAVNEEIDLHTRLINDLDDHVEMTDARLKRVERKTAMLLKKSMQGCCSCLCPCFY